MNLHAHFAVPGSVDTTWLPKVTAVVLACALFIYALAGLESTSFATDFLFIGSLVLVVCSSALALMLYLPFTLFTREEDAALLHRWAVRMSVPGIAAAALFLLLAFDMSAAAWLRNAQVIDTTVVRTLCSRISSSTVKVSIHSEEADGQWCFQRSGAREPDGLVLRVDTDLVRPTLAIGQPGSMRLKRYDSVLFGAGAYIQVLRVS